MQPMLHSCQDKIMHEIVRRLAVRKFNYARNNETLCYKK